MVPVPPDPQSLLKVKRELQSPPVPSVPDTVVVVGAWVVVVVGAWVVVVVGALVVVVVGACVVVEGA